MITVEHLTKVQRGPGPRAVRAAARPERWVRAGLGQVGRPDRWGRWGRPPEPVEPGRAFPHRARAVDDVSFTCVPGTVTGFLGPHGAGKSTTLRILTGHARPTSGRAEILGRAYRDLPKPGRAVGVMLDASALAPGRTGRETLRLTAALLGLTDPDAVEQALADAGLRHAARTRVVDYPTGLRHRLAIANALLGAPAVLVLDEPVAGLDPNGVRWLWRVVRSFAEEGGTVLISACRAVDLRPGVDRVVAIAEGRLVADGAADDLLSASPSPRPATQGLHP